MTPAEMPAHDPFSKHLPHDLVLDSLVVHRPMLYSICHLCLGLFTKGNISVFLSQRFSTKATNRDTMPQTETTEAYADDTPLLELFGDTARTRIISALVGTDVDLSASELARQAGIARPTLYDHLEDLEALGVLEAARETAQGKRYQLAEGALGEQLERTEGVALRNLLRDEGKL